MLIASFGPKSGLSLTHLLEFAALVILVLKYLILLVFGMLVLKLFDDGVGLLLTIGILEVVHVQLILKVVDIGVLLHVDVVESFQFNLKALILFLVLRFHIFDALETLFSTLKFSPSPLNFVLELRLILSQLLDSFGHLAHLSLLGVDNVADALLDILLLRVGVQVA